jgi:hypothetical protein
VLPAGTTLTRAGKSEELLSLNLCRTYSTLLGTTGGADLSADTEKRHCNAQGFALAVDSGTLLYSVTGEFVPRGSSSRCPREACQGVL